MRASLIVTGIRLDTFPTGNLYRSNQVDPSQLFGSYQLSGLLKRQRDNRDPQRRHVHRENTRELIRDGYKVDLCEDERHIPRMNLRVILLNVRVE